MGKKREKKERKEAKIKKKKRGRKKREKKSYIKQSASELCLRAKSYGTSSGLM